VSGCSLSIPKIHALQHYERQTTDFGTPDNFDTESTEHQHITDAREPYLHTNKQDHIPQMIRYMQRTRVLQMKRQYLESLESSAARPTIMHRHSLGSRAKNSPMLVLTAGRQHSVKDLELCIRNFLHNRLFPDGEGSRHRVKKSKLPELENQQVS